MINKRKFLMVIGGLAIIFIFMFAFVLIVPQMEKTGDVERLNPSGNSGKILVVYHPGISSFQKNVTYSFIRGVTERNYSVDITTASSNATTEIEAYDLIVLGTPTYEFAPAKPIEKYIANVGDFKSKKVVIIVTGAGSTDEAVAMMKNSIITANGNIVESIPLWSFAPNEEIYGLSDPNEIAYKKALEIKIN